MKIVTQNKFILNINLSLKILVLTIVLFQIISCDNNIKVDSIITNGKIYSVNDSFDIVESVVIKNGVFFDLGSSKDMLSKYSPAEIIDVNGSFVYPGFNDGHSHFLSYGISEIKYANLMGTSSFDEVINLVNEHYLEYPSEWILGRGWDQNDWDIKEFPDNSALNEAFPETPVVLNRVDGHALIANNTALEIAGITADTKIYGGEIVIADNKPTGLLIDNAMDKVLSVIPSWTSEEKTAALLKAQKDCFAVGLTSVTDAGLDKKDILLIDELHKKNDLNIRVYAMLSPNSDNFNYFIDKGPYHSDKLTVRSIKVYIDGALGSRGALLLEPYSDALHSHGSQVSSTKLLDSICILALDNDFQVNTHAIGDSGNRIVLDSYAKYLRGKNDLRWRVEHAQVVNPNDINYFREYSIIPSVQATHCTSDMYWADERLGKERLKYAYAYNDLLKTNGWIINGTDFPIEGISPIRTFYASVARQDINEYPDGGFQMENSLSRKDALNSITIWPAMGSFDEETKGSIESGKVADFVILDTDLLEVEQSDILKAKVLGTYINGINVYKAY
jgi:predicted amidohydrolase YtcJ